MEPRYRLAVFQDGLWSPARYEGVFGQEERWLAAAPSGSRTAANGLSESLGGPPKCSAPSAGLTTATAATSI